MFYDNFRALCVERGYKPSAALTRMGLSKGNLSAWRSGAVPSSDTVKQMADYFGATTDELLGIKKEPSESENLDETIVALLKRVPERKLQRVKDFLAGLIDD